LWDTINLNEQSASEQGLAWSGSAVSEHLRNSWSASEQGLGRSRGGFSTKMVLTAVDENTPVAVEVLSGQVHEATQVEKMLDASQARLPQIEEAVADKGFDRRASAASDVVSSPAPPGRYPRLTVSLRNKL
jgi:hypothetical protein